MAKKNTDHVPILSREEEAEVIKNILADPDDILSIRLFNLHHRLDD